MTKTLECHSRGDIRYSPFGAKVRVNGRLDTIENHYQRAKVFGDQGQPADWKEAQRFKKLGLRQTGWLICGHAFPVSQDKRDPRRLALDDFGIQFYVMLWVKHIRANPRLVEHARGFDAFNDPFKGNFPFCQAQVWETVAKHEGGLRQLELMGSGLVKILTEARQPTS